VNTTITIIDYGLGNLQSICNSFKYFGANTKITNNPKEIENADHLVLPGVGAFGHGYSELVARKLVEPIKNFVLQERPLLAICLGMQLLLDSSQEFGSHHGLSLIPGEVLPIPKTENNVHSNKIPRIGWFNLTLPESYENWDGTILEDINTEDYFYFVHSFMAVPQSDENRLANCIHDDTLIAAVVSNEYCVGCQFHPEKSGSAGLRIIKRFILI
jgi:imidazole glycerol-phosphate synthase subunit HisH